MTFQWVRLLEALGIVLFFGGSMAALYTISHTDLPQAVLLSAIALPLAYFCADFFTGCVHWVCDSFGDAHTPVWGPMLVAPFRRHHHDPLEITRISLLENLGASAMVGTLVLWLVFPDRPALASTLEKWLQFFTLWFLVFAVVSNLFHRWSHMPSQRRPPWMRRLQQWHVILPPQAHGVHHRKPHRVNYCILSGWANAVSNRVPWHRLEKLLARVGIPTNFN